MKSALHRDIMTYKTTQMMKHINTAFANMSIIKAELERLKSVAIAAREDFREHGDDGKVTWEMIGSAAHYAELLNELADSIKNVNSGKRY